MVAQALWGILLFQAQLGIVFSIEPLKAAQSEPSDQTVNAESSSSPSGPNSTQGNPSKKPKKSAQEINPQLNLLLSQQKWNLQWDASWNQPLFFEPRQSLWHQGTQSHFLRAGYMALPLVNLFFTTGFSHTPDESGYILEGFTITLNRKRPIVFGQNMLIVGGSLNLPSNSRYYQTQLKGTVSLNSIFIAQSWKNLTPIVSSQVSFFWHEWQTLPWGSPSPLWRWTVTPSINYTLPGNILVAAGVGYRATQLYSKRWEDQIFHFEQVTWQLNRQISLYLSHSWMTLDNTIWSTHGTLSWRWISENASQISVGTVLILK